MSAYESSCEAIVDISRPAFEGIETMGAKEVGALGEMVAAAFLSDHGIDVVETNWRTPFGEADIVASQDGLPVLVEVKSRRLLGCPIGHDSDMRPEEAFDACKFERYAKMAEFFKMINEDVDEVRFDVVAITFLSERVAHIHHFCSLSWWDD